MRVNVFSLYFGFKGKKEAGIVLIGLIVFILISAIGFSTAVYVLGRAIEKQRQVNTTERLRVVQGALIGYPYMFANDAGNNSGYFDYNTSFTTNMGDLTDLSTKVFSQLNAYNDAYGNTINLANDGTTYTVESYGLDGVDSGDDIEISFPSGNKTGITVEVSITDLTECVVSSASHIAGTYPADIDYIVNNGSRYDGSVIFDNNNLDVSLIDASGVSYAATYVAVSKVFRWTNISMGWNTVRMVCHDFLDGVNPNNYVDPFWRDSAGDTTNMLEFPIFVYPKSGTQSFNIVYPVMARVFSSHETESKNANTPNRGWADKTVRDDSNDAWDALDEGDNGNITGANWEREYQSVGYGCPNAQHYYDPFIGISSLNGHYKKMRALIKFPFIGNSDYPDLSSSSKISFAVLRLYTHMGGGGANPWGWDAAPRKRISQANAEVRVYIYLRPGWAEGAGTGSHNYSYSLVDDSGTDYNYLQDSWNYGTSASGTPPVRGYHDFNVLYAVQKWVKGDWSNYGFLILNSDESYFGFSSNTNGSWYSFKSNEATDVAKRPALIIAYYR